MKYDDYAWHFGGKFPNDLHKESAATHIGIFFAWVVDNGLEGYYHRREHEEDLHALRNRLMTGREYLIKNCDGKLLAEDMDAEANQFCRYYYGDEHNYGDYVEDYFKVLSCDCASLYHVQDTWGNYERIRPVIDKAYANWCKSNIGEKATV